MRHQNKNRVGPHFILHARKSILAGALRNDQNSRPVIGRAKSDAGRIPILERSPGVMEGFQQGFTPDLHCHRLQRNSLRVIVETFGGSADLRDPGSSSPRSAWPSRADAASEGSFTSFIRNEAAVPRIVWTLKRGKSASRSLWPPCLLPRIFAKWFPRESPVVTTSRLSGFLPLRRVGGQRPFEPCLTPCSLLMAVRQSRAALRRICSPRGGVGSQNSRRP